MKYLLDHSETSDKLKIKVLNVTKKELLRDLQRAPEFDQSALFKKVYEEEFGIFGGAPFGALIGDYEFGHGPEDIELLEKVSQVASAAHAPFLTAAAPDMLNMDSFTSLDAPRDLAKIFDSSEFAKWKSFRQSEDSRYVGLCLPHILMRLPYGKRPCRWMGSTTKKRWMAPTTANICGAMPPMRWAPGLPMRSRNYGWCAAIRGVEGGGLVEGLPTHTFNTDEGDVALKCPTEVADHRPARKGAGRSGLRPAGALQGYGLRGVLQCAVGAEAQMYDKEAANANARLSAQLPYILACRASRIT